MDLSGFRNRIPLRSIVCVSQELTADNGCEYIFGSFLFLCLVFVFRLEMFRAILHTLKCRFRGSRNTMRSLKCKFCGRRTTYLVDLEMQIS